MSACRVSMAASSCVWLSQSQRDSAKIDRAGAGLEQQPKALVYSTCTTTRLSMKEEG